MKKIKGASGITYNAETDSFFIVINRPPRIYEIERNKVFACIRSPKKFKLKYPSGNEYSLTGFSDKTKNMLDAEGVSSIGDGVFIVVDEGRVAVVQVTLTNGSLPTNIQIIAKSDFDENYKNTHNLENKGLEGVAYDGQNKVIYVANEDSPRLVKKIPIVLPAGRGTLTNFELDVAPNSKSWNDVLDSILADLSGLYFDDKRPKSSGNLLILSDQSRTAIEMEMPSGRKVSELDFSRVRGKIPQAEGITMDDDGYIYVVSERQRFKMGSISIIDRSSFLYVFCNTKIEDHCGDNNEMLLLNNQDRHSFLRKWWVRLVILGGMFSFTAIFFLRKRAPKNSHL